MVSCEGARHTRSKGLKSISPTQGSLEPNPPRYLVVSMGIATSRSFAAVFVNHQNGLHQSYAQPAPSSTLADPSVRSLGMVTFVPGIQPARAPCEIHVLCRAGRTSTTHCLITVRPGAQDCCRGKSSYIRHIFLHPFRLHKLDGCAR